MMFNIINKTTIRGNPTIKLITKIQFTLFLGSLVCISNPDFSFYKYSLMKSYSQQFISQNISVKIISVYQKNFKEIS